MSSLSSPSGENVDNHTNLSEIIEQLEAVCHLPPKQRSTDISHLVRRIANVAFTSGIPTDDLTSLVDILTQPNHIDQSSVTTLIKNLYPSSKVPSTIIVKIVCALGPSKTKPSHATQGLLLQWILLVYEVLDDEFCLHRLYRTLFNQLDMLSLRRPLCQLLCMITRRKHVVPYRIQTLLELQQTYGDEAALGSLIRVYKDYYPDIIMTEIRGKRWTQLTPQDQEWIERLRVIQAATMAQKSSRSDLQSQSSFKVVRRGAKRSRASVIPEVRTYGAKEGATVLEDIENVEDFVSSLEKIELPNQLISAVQDPLAMKLLKLRPDRVAELRLEQWLEAFFRDVSRDADAGEENSDALEFVLKELRVYVQHTKAIPSSLERFLSKYLQDRSRHCSKTILDLLCFLPIQKFESLHRDYLAFIEAGIIDSTPQSRIVLLYFYSSLLSHWTNLVLSNSLQDYPEVPVQESISQLLEHASSLALSMLETSPNESEDAVLSCLTNQAHLILHASSTPAIRISLPPPHLVYLLAFTSNLSTISRLCEILTMYKDAFQATRTASMELSSEITWYPVADVTALNRCILDLCNLLWRNKALDCEDPNAIGCLVPADLHEPMQMYLEGLQENLSLATLFSLSHNSAFAAASAACLREMEDNDDAIQPGGLRKRLAEPASHKGLATLKHQGGLNLSWQNYRLKMLQWLDDRGSEGVGSLMRSTMKILKRNES